MSMEYDSDGPIESLGSEDLDGHTIDELAEYLRGGRTPPIASIESSAGCRLALDALERLRALTPELLVADAAAEPEVDESWVATILAGITMDARAGRRVPIASSDASGDLGITEGAVRGVIRAAESAVTGVLIGRCRLEGDVEVPGAPVRIRLDASVSYGTAIPATVDKLRAEVAARLRSHTELQVAGIDVVVSDVSSRGRRNEEER